MPTAGKASWRELLRQGEHLLRRRARPDPCEDAGTDAFLLMQAAGVNVGGQIASVIAGGMILNLIAR